MSHTTSVETYSLNSYLSFYLMDYIPCYKAAAFTEHPSQAPLWKMPGRTSLLPFLWSLTGCPDHEAGLCIQRRRTAPPLTLGQPWSFIVIPLQAALCSENRKAFEARESWVLILVLSLKHYVTWDSHITSLQQICIAANLRYATKMYCYTFSHFM